MTLLYLFYEFAKVGLFTFGGGMATLPLLTDLGEKTGWYGAEFVTEMVAVSNSTPGPIGLNMATYVGYEVSGILGAIVATLGIATPCIIISLIVGAGIRKYSENEAIKNMFLGIRPVVLGLILFAAFTVAKSALFVSGTFSYTKLIFFVIIFGIILLWKKHPGFLIILSAIAGILLKL